jgi:hypothetical protein
MSLTWGMTARGKSANCGSYRQNLTHIERIVAMPEERYHTPAEFFVGPPEFDVCHKMSYRWAAFEELSFVRREAQAEANLAYDAWRTGSCGEAYLVYRAAQDRADAAQDQLAECWGRLG